MKISFSFLISVCGFGNEIASTEHERESSWYRFFLSTDGTDRSLFEMVIIHSDSVSSGLEINMQIV